MSEANILNPSAASLFNPLYGWQRRRLKAFADFVPLLGTPKRRVEIVTGLRYALEFELPKTEALQLDQWAQQYENDFFTLVDWERTRYYSGRFAEDPVEVWAGNNLVRYSGVFEELPGLALNTYPTDWDRDAIFLEERNGLGEDLVKLLTPGNWTFDTASISHGAGRYYAQVANETAEWVYSGYGFRYWADKEPTLGIAEITCTRLRDGAVVIPAQNVDLYSATTLNSAPLFTSNTVMQDRLDQYRVTVRVTGTKNAASTGFFVMADAIQVMR